MLSNTQDILTLKDLQAVLHIGRNQALRLAQENIIAAHKVGKGKGSYRFFKEDVEEYLLRS